ncbi:alpha-D-ribose 1-methylphosphonate 5-triphosphate diphosphatase [Desulfocapsa sp. AH-315-G09]|nr:alpha-D-ribose 1-methylphosphonate 5-triphosphate diphosphatase [Desulfocapsa sp.]MBN4048699.1 alpha-D-ribose 1-methylphosphonate 5-triphosphate diphosphatase [bacterium AH-315-N22]MBN4065632.1 alpha-D-ribose 1-methylphosphonate 5-triphosphate diphosphatase [Desulfocapsa sp. AH-315-G09]
MHFVLRSKRVLTGGVIQPADILIRHGIIEAITSHNSRPTAHDFGNQLIVPGFVDLHSDAVEKEIEPRPGAYFPIDSALVELDKKLTMAGITTMFHAVGFNDEAVAGARSTETAARVICRIAEANREHLFADNLIHIRFELTSFVSVAVIKELIEKGHVRLFSVMDHTPGQGQFKSIESWKKFHQPVYKLSDTVADTIIRQKQQDKADSYEVVKDMLSFAASHDLVLLSHDDDTPQKIDLIRDFGVTVSEFPLNMDVAAYARSNGIATGMGAPNVVRGKSQSGNISAREMIAQGTCDFLCSDYHPSSMLQAPFIINRELGIDLSRCFEMVSTTPAKLARLDDRGEIAAGKIADLVVIDDHTIPKAVLTLKEGTSVYNGIGCICGA